MEEYDISDMRSILIRRVRGLEHADPCAAGHLWEIDAIPGAPITCIYCGEEWKESSPQREDFDG